MAVTEFSAALRSRPESASLVAAHGEEAGLQALGHLAEEAKFDSVLPFVCPPELESSPDAQAAAYREAEEWLDRLAAGKDVFQSAEWTRAEFQDCQP